MSDDEPKPNFFDRQMGLLKDLPDVVMSRPSTITVVTPLIGDVQTFIVQTAKQKDVGDTIFLQYLDASGSRRIVIPPRVTEAIARQRDGASRIARVKHAKSAYEERKATGKLGAFAKNQGRGFARKKKSKGGE